VYCPLPSASISTLSPAPSEAPHSFMLRAHSVGGSTVSARARVAAMHVGETHPGRNTPGGLGRHAPRSTAVVLFHLHEGVVHADAGNSGYALRGTGGRRGEVGLGRTQSPCTSQRGLRAVRTFALSSSALLRGDGRVCRGSAHVRALKNDCRNASC
jgi:hypothetical protein